MIVAYIFYKYHFSKNQNVPDSYMYLVRDTL